MQNLSRALTSGQFLTRDRIRGYSLICLVLTLMGLAGLILTANGKLAFDNQPLGTDFSNIYAAGQMVNDGRAAEVWDWEKHFAEQYKVFGPQLDGVYGWQYPPFYLPLASVLALLPYLGALAVWCVIGLALYVGSMRQILGHLPGWWLPVIGTPALYVNLTHGHNGFLTAALFAAAFFSIGKRPILAGIFIGLLAYKPHFGVLIPIALLAGGYYRTFLSASITVIVMGVIVTLAYGFDIWPAFVESFKLSREIVLEDGNTGWHKIQTLFSAVMLWTNSLGLAYFLQGILFAMVLGVVVTAFLYDHSIEERAGILVLGSLLVTPYGMDYDLLVLSPALAFLAVRGMRDGFSDWEVFVLVLAWFAPLVTRPLMLATGIPFALIVMLCLFYILTSRILKNSAAQRLKPFVEKGI